VSEPPGTAGAAAVFGRLAQTGIDEEAVMSEQNKREFGPADLLEYKPGDVVPQSGVYRFVHDPGHAEPEEINAIKGELFPACRHCRNGRMTLVDNAFNTGAIEQFQSG
jgi:hypothetical protein